MSSSTGTAVRPPSFSAIPVAMPSAGGCNSYRARGQNFEVEWLEIGPSGAASFATATEQVLILPDRPVTLLTGAGRTEVPGHSVTIIPPGDGSIEAADGSTAILLRPASGEGGDHLNASDYRTADPRVAAATVMQRRSDAPDGPRVYPVSEIRPAQGRPRLKMLQSAEMSINWVEYDGPRDRTSLSPHSHDDFEQGSLGIVGAFTHHLRVPWGPDATLWQEDLHLEAPAPSLTIFPPGLIHTSEGTGPGRHLLIDVFCPARADFRARGWIANAEDYEEPEGSDRPATAVAG